MDIEMPAWLAGPLSSPVAIFGTGVSGQAAKALVESLGGTARFFDERSGDAFDAAAAREFDLVVTSPGFASDHPWLQLARDAECLIIPELELGAALWKGPLIAVTGTNGKTTLVEFLVHAFQHAGKQAIASGNIGTPLSQSAAEIEDAEMIAVCECSSFQAECLRRFEADALAWTNFAEDHLDRHESMGGYFAAKHKLVERVPGRACFYGASVLSHAESLGFEMPSGGLVSEASAAELGVEGTVFEFFPERKSYVMARRLWLHIGLLENDLKEAARSFCKSAHRLEKVREVDGVSFWNDSKATNFHAVYAAINRFEEKVAWVGGGKDKGGDLGAFVARIAPRLKSAYLLGQTSNALQRELAKRGIKAYVYQNIEEATQAAFAESRRGDVVLLSPGFSSLDMFEGYAQRGERFARAIAFD